MRNYFTRYSVLIIAPVELRIIIEFLHGDTVTEPLEIKPGEEFIKKRNEMIIILIITLAVSSVAFLGLHSETAFTVNVMSITVTIYSYENNQTQVVSTNIIPFNHETLYGEEAFLFTFNIKNFNNSDLKVIDLKSQTTGFVVKLNYPEMIPFVILPHSNTDLKMNIFSPDYNFVGNLSIGIYEE